MNKKLVFALYTLIVVCIGFATVIEKYHGTAFVGEHIYGAWWFSALWGALVVASLAYMMKQKLYKRTALMLLHVSFVVILAGSLTTHLFARRGTVRLATNLPESTFVNQKDNIVEHLPFSLTLKEFRIVNYPGTDAPLDYQSIIQSGPQEVVVSMNHIGHIDGYRLFQQSYSIPDPSLTASGRPGVEYVTLGISYDPYGIAITYIGYLMLLLGMIATLLSRHPQLRSLYRKAVAAALLLAGINASAAEGLPTVRKDIAHSMGTISLLYQNRICPLNTVATDFVMKLTGSASWEGYSADEIFTSWMIYYSPWEQQKLIRVKSREVQQLLGIDGQWASYSDFLNEYHEYKLKDAVKALRTGEGTIDKKSLMDADEKFHMVEMFYQGQFIRMFPYQVGNTVNWYMPGGQSLPRDIPVKEQFFIKQSMDFLTESIVTGQHDRALEIIAKIKLFQREQLQVCASDGTVTGSMLPGDGACQAEIFYNTMRSQKWPVFLVLTLSLLLCACLLFMGRLSFAARLSALAFDVLLFAYISIQFGLRWWISGHIPVSNGHETMLFMAWVVLVLTFMTYRKFPVILGFGPLVSAFCLLVAMLAGTGSQITPLMPVLQSPLLSVHVMTVMCAYALFALQVLLGVQALLLMKKGGHASQLERITALSQLLLYPAVFLLTVGIFLGAVWANVSWGNYWSWDPKESWALITMMVYAVPLHKASVGIFKKQRYYHVYMIAAFLVVIITYFGVNYLLGGMHSYA